MSNIDGQEFYGIFFRAKILENFQMCHFHKIPLECLTSYRNPNYHKPFSALLCSNKIMYDV